MKTSLIFLPILFINSPALAEVGGAVLQNIQTIPEKLYIKNPGDNYLTLAECEASQSIERRGTGVLVPWSGVDYENSNCVPSDTYNNHDRIKIMSSDHGLNVRFDQIGSGYVGGVFIELQVNANARARFTKGNWNTFQSGGYVEFTLTPDGGNSISTAQGNEMCSVMKSSLYSMMSMQGLIFSDYDCTSHFQNRGISFFRGTKNRIREYNRPKFVTTLGFLVRN